MESFWNKLNFSVLPMRGTRDIKSLDYDPVAGLVYWIDNGSNKCNGAQRRKGPNRNRLGFAIQC